MRRKGGLGSVLAIGAVMAIAPASAMAVTARIGSPLAANFIASGMGGGGNVTWAQTNLAGSPTRSPSDGTVVSWRNWTQGGTFRLVVIRPTGAQFTQVAASDLYAPPNFAASPSIPTNLPIKSGDLIGIELTTGNGYDATGVAAGVAGATAVAWAPHLAGGQTRSADPLAAGNEIALQATVRYCLVPKLKGMKIGAARSALAAADCAVGQVTRPKKKAARKRAKFVRSQSVAAGASISDRAPVDLRLGKRPKKRK